MAVKHMHRQEFNDKLRAMAICYPVYTLKFAQVYGRPSQGSILIMTLYFVKEWRNLVSRKVYGSQKNEILSDVK